MSYNNPVTFTLDLEDHYPAPNPAPRYPAITHKILDFLAEQKIKGTFFTLGEIVKDAPDLIRRIHNEGHEVAFHTYAHVPLTKENPERFERETAKSKALIEDLTGAPVLGFRAPGFSLTPQSDWVLPILKKLGFTYSSSILPIHHPFYGFPTAPRQPFKWNNGLIEIPVPIGQIGPLALPFLGGIYMRYLPDFLIARAMKQQKNEAALWTYCHPYDFDTEEKFFVMRETALWASFILWINRRNSFRKIKKIMGNGAGLPFRDMIKNGAFDNLAVFNPAIDQ